MLIFEVITFLAVTTAMSTAVAHALEFPGKSRLDEKTYRAVQAIYYPGFTIAGIGEPLAVICTLSLTLAMRHDRSVFWWSFSAFVSMLAMHAVFWLITQPTNRYWLKQERLGKIGTRFFAIDQPKPSGSHGSDHRDWRELRNRWEYSHILRAILATIALISLVITVAA